MREENATECNDTADAGLLEYCSSFTFQITKLALDFLQRGDE